MKTYDILIPCAAKDAETLDICIKSCRKRIKNNISKIYVVSNNKNENIKKITQDNNCEFVDEDDVLGIRLDDLRKFLGSWHRLGWMFQQFLKLCGNVTEQEDFIVIDSEVVFLKDITFEDNNGDPIFYWDDKEHYPSYFEFMSKVLDMHDFKEVSFIIDFMAFNKKHLAEIRKTIEEKTGDNWMFGILKNIDFRSPSPFSEFELYGNSYKGGYKLSEVKKLDLGKLYTSLDEIERDYKDLDVIVMHRHLRG